MTVAESKEVQLKRIAENYDAAVNVAPHKTTLATTSLLAMLAVIRETQRLRDKAASIVLDALDPNPKRTGYLKPVPKPKPHPKAKKQKAKPKPKVPHTPVLGVRNALAHDRVFPTKGANKQIIALTFKDATSTEKAEKGEWHWHGYLHEDKMGDLIASLAAL